MTRHRIDLTAARCVLDAPRRERGTVQAPGVAGPPQAATVVVAERDRRASEGAMNRFSRASSSLRDHVDRQTLLAKMQGHLPAEPARAAGGEKSRGVESTVQEDRESHVADTVKPTKEVRE